MRRSQHSVKTVEMMKTIGAAGSSSSIIKCWWTCTFVLIFVKICEGSWGTPGLGQYHIQTDEGPERYFRYQTDNGQYRKEKRLQDGTVIGTDAWIDADGILRQKDYIADQQGYRILKSKTVFVGKGRPIEEAIKALKKIPTQAGELLRNGYNSLTRNRQSTHSTTTTTTTTPATIRPIAIQTDTPQPVAAGYDYTLPQSTPSVFIRPHSEPLDESAAYVPDVLEGPLPAKSVQTKVSDSSIRVPSNVFEPPFKNDLEPIAVYPTSSTSSHIAADYGPPIALYPSSTPLPPISSTARPDFLSVVSSSRYSPSSTVSPIDQLNNDLLPPALPFNPTRSYPSTSARPYLSSTERPLVPVANNDISVQPIYTRPRISGNYKYYRPAQPATYNNNLGNGYDPQFPLYDGIATNQNGFRYYLPRQYHEEENLDPERRAGSFGYIDPFGIRRVVYYNTGPGQGFVHRKNNRYVGFDATPYDPRPL